MALIDRDISLCEQILYCLKDDHAIRVIGLGYDGNDGLALIQEKKPDIIVIDPILEYVDGYSILRKLKESRSYRPIVYVLQHYNSAIVNRIMSDFDVDFISIKPIYAQHVIDNLHDIIAATKGKPGQEAEDGAAKPQPEIANHVFNVLCTDLGLKNSTSCIRLRDVIVEVLLMQSDILNLNSDIYPAIARRHRTTKISIEKNVRDSIKRIITSKMPLCYELFGERESLTNKEFLQVFIAYMRDYLLRNGISLEKPIVEQNVRAK